MRTVTPDKGSMHVGYAAAFVRLIAQGPGIATMKGHTAKTEIDLALLTFDVLRPEPAPSSHQTPRQDISFDGNAGAASFTRFEASIYLADYIDAIAQLNHLSTPLAPLTSSPTLNSRSLQHSIANHHHEDLCGRDF